MPSLITRCALALPLLLAAPASAALAFEGLGDLPGGAFDSQANAVSDDGTTVVGRGKDALGCTAYRWTRAGGMQPIPPPGEPVQSDATDVSADGSVIAAHAIGGCPENQYDSWWSTAGRAYRWRAADGAALLPTFSYYDESDEWTVSA